MCFHAFTAAHKLHRLRKGLARPHADKMVEEIPFEYILIDRGTANEHRPVLDAREGGDIGGPHPVTIVSAGTGIGGTPHLSHPLGSGPGHLQHNHLPRWSSSISTTTGARIGRPVRSRVGQTIAYLEGANLIDTTHVAGALQ